MTNNFRAPLPLRTNDALVVIGLCGNRFVLLDPIDN
jgi:hypothetical protein